MDADHHPSTSWQDDSPTIRARSRASSMTTLGGLRRAAADAAAAAPTRPSTTAGAFGGQLQPQIQLSRASSVNRSSSGKATPLLHSGQASPAPSTRSSWIRSSHHSSGATQAGTPGPGILSKSPTLTSPSPSGTPTPSASASVTPSLTSLPTLKALESYNVRNVAAALDHSTPDALRHIDDAWQSLCVRVLPLFNGEGIRGHVEDLNDLVISRIQRTFARTSSRPTASHTPSSNLSTLVTGLLVEDLTDLLTTGFLTLSSKLSPPNAPLPDDKFLHRLDETWAFFWSGLLPNLEAIFWPLRCDERLKAAVGGDGFDRLQGGRTRQGEGRIDIRKFAIISFRDQVILPEEPRLMTLFQNGSPTNDDDEAEQQLPSARRRRQEGEDGPDAPSESRQSRSGAKPAYVSNGRSVTFATSSPLSSPSSSIITPRRRQLFSVLASVLTADDRQLMVETLLKSLRSNRPDRRRSPLSQHRVDDDDEGHRPPFFNHSSSASTMNRNNTSGRKSGFLGSVYSDGHRSNRRNGGGAGSQRPLSREEGDGGDTPFSDQTSDYYFDSPGVPPSPVIRGSEETRSGSTPISANERIDDRTITSRRGGGGAPNPRGSVLPSPSTSSLNEFGQSVTQSLSQSDQTGTTGGTIRAFPRAAIPPLR
ncbi:BQ5605_C007g04570 [Microbotryum silenes-dioicae]|uniref:BQ5605_C007g04570 protein n=1 Tax=Microbotryum silenes-dioicae TaxID=796604 RepID=A0A2X0M7F4_9BASI|nr:BQ5605_C007g04570 [Microbotryum silenes-dioicae]